MPPTFANCQSFAKLVIDNDICGMALRFVKGIKCSGDTIGLDIIKAAGREAKDYLSSEHTLNWFREELFFPSEVIARNWIREGVKSSTAWERAQEEVKERLAKYEPTRLPDDKVKEIKAIMRSYAKSKGVDKLPQVDEGWDG